MSLRSSWWHGNDLRGMVEVHEVPEIPKGGVEAPKKGGKRSPRCSESPRKVMEVSKNSGGGPQGPQVWSGSPQGFDRCP